MVRHISTWRIRAADLRALWEESRRDADRAPVTTLRRDALPEAGRVGYGKCRK